jgi:hypothetical protein
MVKTIRVSTMTEDLNIDEDVQSYLFAKTVNYFSQVDSALTVTGDWATIAVSGKLGGISGAIAASQGNTFDLAVNEGGVLSGVVAAVFAGGDGTEIHNSGVIKGMGEGWGISIGAGDDILVENDGKIISQSSKAIQTVDDDTTIINREGGRIAGLFGVYYNGDENTVNKLDNYGVIAAQALHGAVEGWDGVEIVVNRGRLQGAVSLGNNNDSLDSRGGSISGGIYLGLGDDVADLRGAQLGDFAVRGEPGNDVLYIDDARYYLAESYGQGNDTIYSAVSYVMSDDQYVENLVLLGKKALYATGSVHSEQLTGNAGDNVIRGLGGRDQITGGGGNDRLFGGDGQPDVFFFQQGSGRDVISDFQSEFDEIHLDRWNGIDSLDAVMAHTTFKNGNAIISAGNDTITLIGIDEQTLRNDQNFVFSEAD